MTRTKQFAKLAEALAAAQAEMEPARRNAKNEEIGNTYADQAAVFEAARVLAKHGIAIVQGVVWQDGRAWVSTLLAHKSGQAVETLHPIAVDPRQGAHKFEGAHTYAKRIALASAIGLPVGEDDDGNVAAGRASPQQRPNQPPRQQQAPRQEQRTQQPPPLPELSTEQLTEVAEILQRVEEIEESITLRDYMADLERRYPDRDHPVRQHVREPLKGKLRDLDARARAA